MQANLHTADTLSCDGLYENPLALGPCKLYGPVGTLPYWGQSTRIYHYMKARILLSCLSFRTTEKNFQVIVLPLGVTTP